jgi:mono/diheme cytochrome c family protein
MHHGLLQHRNFLTTYAKAGYLARNLQAGMMTGRIYRIVRDGATLFERPRMSKAPTTQLVEYLSHPNGWWRDTAQRLLVERNDYKVAPALKKLAKSTTQPAVARLHALWTLDGMRQIDTATIAVALGHPDAKVRAAAIRISETLLGNPGQRATILPAVLKLANDHQPEVRLQFALTISGVGAPEADQAALRVLQESGTNTYVRDAVVSGIRGRELWFLERLLDSTDRTADEESVANAALLRALSQPIANEGNPKRAVALLDLIARQPAEREWCQVAMLDGFPDPPKNRNARRPRSIMLNDAPAAIADLQASPNPAVRETLTKVTALVHWPGQAGYEPPPPPVPLTPEQQARFDAGKKVYSVTCAACHKSDGMGQSGLAPPLVGSDWVLGPDTRIGRIVIHGLRGPVTLDGRLYNLEMPGLPTLKDDDVAAVLTYVRREWDHTAPPVEPATIAKIRKENAERTGPWTEKELLNVRAPSTARTFEQ